jgi:hypothetical protein
MKRFAVLLLVSAAGATVPTTRNEALPGEDRVFWDRFLRHGYDNYNSLAYPTAAPQKPLPTFNCSSTQRSGGQSSVPQEYMIDLQKTRGTFDAFYEMYLNPDGLDIFYEGANIFSTGGLVSGSRNFTVPYGSARSKSTMITLKITAPNTGTGWVVAVGCPE